MRVIAAIDGSTRASELIENVARCKWPENTEIKILSVVEPLIVGHLPAREWAELDSSTHKRTALASAECEKYWRLLEDTLPECTIHFEVRHGDAREEILKAATEWNANMIMIASPGNDPGIKSDIGTVSHAVTTNAPCSVQVMRSSKLLPINPPVGAH